MLTGPGSAWPARRPSLGRFPAHVEPVSGGFDAIPCVSRLSGLPPDLPSPMTATPSTIRSRSTGSRSSCRGCLLDASKADAASQVANLGATYQCHLQFTPHKTRLRTHRPAATALVPPSASRFRHGPATSDVTCRDMLRHRRDFHPGPSAAGRQERACHGWEGPPPHTLNGMALLGMSTCKSRPHSGHTGASSRVTAWFYS